MNKVQVIQIMTVEDCNRYCWFCPNSTREMTGLVMADNIWDIIVGDLFECGYKGAIHLHLQNEPLLDPKLNDRVKQLRRMFPKNRILFITNGEMLTLEKVNEFVVSGITEVVVSDYDNKIDFAHPKMRVRSLEKIAPTLFNRAGHADVNTKTTRTECDMMDDKIAINYKGDVILCCSDYDYEVVFGNVEDKSVQSIYDSPEYRRYREMNKKGDIKKMHVCERCNRVA